ncbi:MAG: hypothetical protein RLY20_1826 [Verrucomicrobiota bacterium]
MQPPRSLHLRPHHVNLQTDHANRANRANLVRLVRIFRLPHRSQDGRVRLWRKR